MFVQWEFNALCLVPIFQHTLLIEIRTFAAWLKSTVLLKTECRVMHIYMKTECL